MNAVQHGSVLLRSFEETSRSIYLTGIRSWCDLRNRRERAIVTVQEACVHRIITTWHRPSTNLYVRCTFWLALDEHQPIFISSNY